MSQVNYCHSISLPLNNFPPSLDPTSHIHALPSSRKSPGPSSAPGHVGVAVLGNSRHRQSMSLCRSRVVLIGPVTLRVVKTGERPFVKSKGYEPQEVISSRDR